MNYSDDPDFDPAAEGSGDSDWEAAEMLEADSLGCSSEGEAVDRADLARSLSEDTVLKPGHQNRLVLRMLLGGEGEGEVCVCGGGVGYPLHPPPSRCGESDWQGVDSLEGGGVLI
jgi:hypothetical protein